MMKASDEKFPFYGYIITQVLSQNKHTNLKQQKSGRPGNLNHRPTDLLQYYVNHVVGIAILRTKTGFIIFAYIFRFIG